MTLRNTARTYPHVVAADKAGSCLRTRAVGNPAPNVRRRVLVHGFELTVQQIGAGAVSIRLSGALDLAYAYRFDDELRHAERDASCLVLDLRELHFVDSAGISRILAARRRARRAGRRLVLVRGSSAVQRFMQLAALTEHFEYVGSPEEAVSGQEAPGAVLEGAPGAPGAA
jgi:anti-anti-sigma factor